MLFFPNSKINLGLSVTEKRADGFHNIETVLYPVQWCDALEVIENKDSEPITLSFSGYQIAGDLNENLVYKAWKMLSDITSMPCMKVHLHKNIPMGAGLGGGSADAACFIDLADKKFDLGLHAKQKIKIASALGSDCAFFLENLPVFAFGKGDQFLPIKADLRDYYILMVYPGIHSNTREAYQNHTPGPPEYDLKSVVEGPVKEWRNKLTNDFEKTLFKKYPLIKDLKESMYNSGAVYAAMSGSGSAVFGLFSDKPQMNFNKDFKFYLQNPSSKLLNC